MTSIDISRVPRAHQDFIPLRTMQDAPQDARKAFVVIAVLIALLFATTLGSYLESNAPDQPQTELSDVHTETSDLEDWHGNVRRSHWRNQTERLPR